jgi:hypothetical protein
MFSTTWNAFWLPGSLRHWSVSFSPTRSTSRADLHYRESRSGQPLAADIRYADVGVCHQIRVPLYIGTERPVKWMRRHKDIRRTLAALR